MGQSFLSSSTCCLSLIAPFNPISVVLFSSVPRLLFFFDITLPLPFSNAPKLIVQIRHPPSICLFVCPRHSLSVWSTSFSTLYPPSELRPIFLTQTQSFTGGGIGTRAPCLCVVHLHRRDRWGDDSYPADQKRTKTTGCIIVAKSQNLGKKMSDAERKKGEERRECETAFAFCQHLLWCQAPTLCQTNTDSSFLCNMSTVSEECLDCVCSSVTCSYPLYGLEFYAAQMSYCSSFQQYWKTLHK